MLELITVEQANKLKIQTETPVFVSYYVKKRKRCYLCRKYYTPLVYPWRRPIYAQHHDHNCFGGGIYSLDADRRRVPRDPTFIAEGQTVGKIIHANIQEVQSEGVILERLLEMRCWSCRHIIQGLIGLRLDREVKSIWPTCTRCIRKFNLLDDKNMLPVALSLIDGEPFFTDIEYLKEEVRELVYYRHEGAVVALS